MENDNAKPEQPQSDEELRQQFAQMSVEVWSMTLVAYKRRIESLESQAGQLEAAKLLQQALIDTLHARLDAIESLFRRDTVQ